MKKLLTVLGAAVAGFAAGILTAPKSGKETRAELKQKADHLKQEAGKTAKKASAAAKDSFENVKAGADKVGQTVGKTARAVKTDVEKRFSK
ncbi:MAG: YtxH domain-containing protein [Candidatus Saccharibacteria bacterium]|nr:YtxH domain-containing protein [Candidatus Saccharibacteria bacterium]